MILLKILLIKWDCKYLYLQLKTIIVIYHYYDRKIYKKNMYNYQKKL